MIIDMQAGSSGSDFYKKNKRNNNKKPNKGTFYALIAVIVFLIISTVSGGIGNNGSMIKLSEFVNSVNNNQIEKANVLNETVVGTLKDGTKYTFNLANAKVVKDGKATTDPISLWEQGNVYTYTINISKQAVELLGYVKDWVKNEVSGNAELIWDDDVPTE